MKKRNRKLIPISERIERHYLAEPNSGCWLWHGLTNNKGYGKIVVSGFGGGTKQKRFAHRAMWEIHNGPIPKGVFVCHRCDTPPCVNPAHLFLGTHDENMKDMQQKGRGTLLKDKCLRGHPLSGKNLIRYKEGSGRVSGCRTCRAATKKKHRAKKKAEALA